MIMQKYLFSSIRAKKRCVFFRKSWNFLLCVWQKHSVAKASVHIKQGVFLSTMQHKAML